MGNSSTLCTPKGKSEGFPRRGVTAVRPGGPASVDGTGSAMPDTARRRARSSCEAPAANPGFGRRRRESTSVCTQNGGPWRGVTAERPFHRAAIGGFGTTVAAARRGWHAGARRTCAGMPARNAHKRTSGRCGIPREPTGAGFPPNNRRTIAQPPPPRPAPGPRNRPCGILTPHTP